MQERWNQWCTHIPTLVVIIHLYWYTNCNDMTIFLGFGFDSRWCTGQRSLYVETWQYLICKAGPIAKRIGIKLTMAVIIGCSTVGTIATILSVHFAIVTCARFFVGFGVGKLQNMELQYRYM